jgi:hypothetical protein
VIALAIAVATAWGCGATPRKRGGVSVTVEAHRASNYEGIAHARFDDLKASHVVHGATADDNRLGVRIRLSGQQ